MVVSTPWVRASTDMAAAPAWMVWDEPNPRAALTVAETSDGGTASARSRAGKRRIAAQDRRRSGRIPGASGVS